MKRNIAILACFCLAHFAMLSLRVAHAGQTFDSCDLDGKEYCDTLAGSNCGTPIEACCCGYSFPPYTQTGNFCSFYCVGDETDWCDGNNCGPMI